MRAPAFWSAEAGGRDAAPLLQALARPLSWAYAAAGSLALARARPQRVNAFVICVGNVSVGGVGKTPIAQALRAELARRGVLAATLSRGYGGRLKGPVAVDPSRHVARDVGDEPLLHAADGMAIVSADRPAGAALAVAQGARAVLMDDGFQNHSLAKDLSILVFDAEAGLGNGRVLPAGPLREPLSAALKRAQAAIVMRREAGRHARPAFLEGFAGPVLDAWLEAEAQAPPGPLVAFAGLGRPEKFFDSLARAGGEIAEAAPFPDHHPYGASDLAWLAASAEDRGARLITTAKDFVRLPPAFRERVLVFRVAARFADPAALWALTPFTEPASRSP